MADDSKEEQGFSQDSASTKAAIFETFNKLKKWREEQVQQFRNMQLLESQKLIRLSNESQKNFQKVLESATQSPESSEVRKKYFLKSSSVSSISEQDNLDFCDTLQESSISGHLQRCFDDSSQSSISVNKNESSCDTQKPPVYPGVYPSEAVGNTFENKDPVVKETQSSVSIAPKRPFLKKGTGLLRYMPKSANNRQQPRKKAFTTKLIHSPKRNSNVPQRSLKLKPVLRKTDATSDSTKHIRFDIPGDANEVNDESQSEVDPQSFLRSDTNDEYSMDKHQLNFNSSMSDSSPESYVSQKDKFEAISNSEILNSSRENKELEEFEILEKCAQNSSFNSDSSVVQRVLHGEKAKKKPMEPCLENVNGKENCKSFPSNPIFSPKIDLSKYLEEVHARKQIVQKVIADINPRIQSLQKEIFSCREEGLNNSDMSERCSTPIEDLSLEDGVLPSAVPENDESIISLDLPAPSSAENIIEPCSSDCQSCNINHILKNLHPNQNSTEEENSVCESTDLSPQRNQEDDFRSKIREKVQELEKEIEIYQQHNAKLASVCKERDEVLRKLQKEREDFNKYKEAEKKKIEAEIQEERKQIKRQKETFMRYQKLRRDHPTRKERDELNSLRQEVEKLQEELKRQKIKHTSESRRLKNQLDAAEKERDIFKLENIRLEEQVQDLLAALKARIKKNPEANPIQFDKAEDDEGLTKESPKNKVTENPAHEEYRESDLSKKSDQTSPKFYEKKSKPKVRFNLTNGCPDDRSNSDETHAENEQESVSTEENLPEIFETVNCDENITTEKSDETPSVNLSNITVSVEAEFKEINHGNKIERIHASGEREIIFNSKTRKIISADGQSIKFLFYNGDSKEIFPDRREIYRYVNGVTETHHPDGLEVTEFPNGQVQRRYPDGQKEVKFPDGTKHCIYADGSEEIVAADGSVVNLSADGTETIEFANGQREIRTATYKRREFPDGSVKIYYNSGRLETRYSDGRIRIKNKDGKVVVDTKYSGIPKDVSID